jgi:polyisoprenoid-binding protein YceI
MDMDSINFGLEAMTAHAKRDDILDVEQFPTSTYTGTLTKFNRTGEPTAVEGHLTLHGVTQPVDLQINRFQCQPNGAGVDTCGADVSASFNRDDFGVTFGQANGFLMFVNILIQIEAQRVEPNS